MENNQRNSRKRLNSLILLVAFTAVMLIVSTYAWFSTQRNVTLTGLQGVVNVAEGLQISLDAERWVNAIDFSDFEQPANGGEWTMKTGASAQYISTDTGVSFQKPRGASGGITNVTPSEYLPVSTVGTTASTDGLGKAKLNFYNGEVQNFDHLEKIEEVTENSGAGYFAFDLFLMNTSASTVKFDKIQLDGSSDIKGNVETTGIQNTARIAFALYENSNDAAGFKEYDQDGYTAGGSMTIHSANQLSPAQIVTGTNAGNIEDIAIWEPNADDHASSIVKQFAGQMTWPSSWDNGNSITLASQSLTGDFADGHYLPTYGLTAASKDVVYKNKTEDKTGTDNDVYGDDLDGIKDIYYWAEKDTTQEDKYVGTDISKLALQITTQTSADTNRTDPIDLRSIAEIEASGRTTNSDGTTTADKAFDIEPNQYHKIRVYVWIEGQDPDCINYASLGGGLTLDLGFSKPASGS